MIEIYSKPISSNYLLEEYFPIKIHFSNYNEETLKNCIRIDYDKSNALEMLFDKNAQKEIVEINLLLTNKFEVINNIIIIPQNIDNCSISATNFCEIKADIFINIYNNGVELKNNNNPSKRSVLCDNVIFQFSEKMDINTIILTNISPELHKHIITELKYEVEQNQNYVHHREMF